MLFRSICGTGGDGTGSYNISTASQFVGAACGVPVANHGNRAASSKSGASYVLEALGVNIEADLALVEKALAEAGTCFLMAQRHHSAMRHVGPARVELGTRTIFNLLGPLSNPAKVKRQLIGVFSPQWLEPLAAVLRDRSEEHTSELQSLMRISYAVFCLKKKNENNKNKQKHVY